MHDLQKTIRYGFLLILEVIALCVGMIYSARTVRAETEALMSDFARIFNISGKEKVLFSAAMKNILNIDPEVQQPDRKVTEVVTENWTVISGKRLDLILKYMGDINFEKDGICFGFLRSALLLPSGLPFQKDSLLYLFFDFLHRRFLSRPCQRSEYPDFYPGMS